MERETTKTTTILPPPSNPITMGPYQPPPRQVGPGQPARAPYVSGTPPVDQPQPGFTPAVAGVGGSGAQTGSTTSAGRGDIPMTMPSGAPRTGGQPYTPISGGLPVSPLGSIPGEQVQPSGNSPGNFTARPGESQGACGARIRDGVREIVRRNGGTPAENA
jgi:hypothetical protein